MTALERGPLRYTELLQAVIHARPHVVHNKTLGATLIYLREHGLVEHHQDKRSHDDYRLTSAGVELNEFLAALRRWTRQNHHAAECAMRREL